MFVPATALLAGRTARNVYVRVGRRIRAFSILDDDVGRVVRVSSGARRAVHRANCCTRALGSGSRFRPPSRARTVLIISLSPAAAPAAGFIFWQCRENFESNTIYRRARRGQVRARANDDGTGPVFFLKIRFWPRFWETGRTTRWEPLSRGSAVISARPITTRRGRGIQSAAVVFRWAFDFWCPSAVRAMAAKCYVLDNGAYTAKVGYTDDETPK